MTLTPAQTLACWKATHKVSITFPADDAWICRTFGLLVALLPCCCRPRAPHLCVLPEGIRLHGRSQKEEGKWGREGTPLPTDPSTTVSFTDTSWDQMAKVMPWPAQRSEVGGGGVTEIFLPGDHNEAQQVCSFKHTHGGGACIYPALLSPRSLVL